MGFPIRKAAVRATLISAMLGGGLLFAGISQAQDASIQQERGDELFAAAGGPESTAHLIPYRSDKAAVEARDAEVAGSPSEASPTATTGPADLAPTPLSPVPPSALPTAYTASSHP